jgi:2-iminobutanoate/2-iminopropanoate deaminase
MRRRWTEAEGAPRAVGPYALAVEAGTTVYLSGNLPIRPDTGELAGTNIESQTRQVLDNIVAVLAACGLGPDAVVKTTVFLTDLADFAAMNAVYARCFGDTPPARSTVQVAGLPRDARVEIEAIAVRAPRG